MTGLSVSWRGFTNRIRACARNWRLALNVQVLCRTGLVFGFDQDESNLYAVGVARSRAVTSAMLLIHRADKVAASVAACRLISSSPTPAIRVPNVSKASRFTNVQAAELPFLAWAGSFEPSKARRFAYSCVIRVPNVSKASRFTNVQTAELPF